MTAVTLQTIAGAPAWSAPLGLGPVALLALGLGVALLAMARRERTPAGSSCASSPSARS